MDKLSLKMDFNRIKEKAFSFIFHLFGNSF